MNLVPCRECRRSVSASARSCPECGAPFPGRTEWKGWGLEWKSKIAILGYPLVHLAIGRQSNGKMRVARGIIAIGQYAIGVITIAQFGIGLLGIGQFVLGFMVIAQFAAGLYFALGQFALGYVAVGQIAAGYYARCQIGLAPYLWSAKVQDAEAVRFFNHVVMQIKSILR